MKQILKSVLVVGLGIAMLSGCGSDGGSSPEDSKIDSKASESIQPTQTAIPSPSFSKPSSGDIDAMFQNVRLDSSSNAGKWLEGFAKAHSTTDANSLYFGASSPVDQKGKMEEKSINYNGHKGVAQVYSPAGAYNFLKNQNEQMSKDKVNHTLSNNALQTEDSVTIYFGDALVNVQASGSDQDKILTELKQSGKGDIESSQCKNLNVSEGDIKRNQWISGGNYTGAIQSVTVTSNNTLGNFPKPIIPSLLDVKDKDVSKPEFPLPSSFIEEPPEHMDKPNLSEQSLSNVPATQKTIDVQVKDIVGPGCGWDWAKFDNHEPSQKDLDSRKGQQIDYEKKVMDLDLEKYMKDNQSTAINSLNEMAQANKWNIYVEKVNKAHDQWKSMTQARQDFKPTWDEYVKARNYWYDFDSLKNEARLKYQKDVLDCSNRVSKQKEWDADNPGATDSPNRPSTCNTEPVKPKIIEESRPAEPKQPKIPDNVTIPASWDKPHG